VESQIKVTANKSNNTNNNRHNLKTKVRVNEFSKLNKNINHQRRFNPYKSPLNNDLSNQLDELDLSIWSLDDEMHNLIYNDNNNKNKTASKNNSSLMRKKVTYKDVDQDTLADLDVDCLLNELLEEEKQ